MNKIENETDKQEQIERGKRIKQIREDELLLNKSQLAERIGTSSQFLGLVEEGKGNLVYKSIRKLRDLSGHSADYLLFGLDDHVIDETKKYLEILADYLIVPVEKEERRERELLTENRLATINKRETSFEGLVS